MLHTTGTRPLSWYDQAPDKLEREEDDDRERDLAEQEDDYCDSELTRRKEGKP
jgi:hypothetical protein